MTYGTLTARRLVGLMLPVALALWGLVAFGTTSSLSVRLDGQYSSRGEVLLSNGEVRKIHQTLAFHNGRFYTMTRSAPIVAEASGRVETDLLGKTRLIVEEGAISGLEDAGADQLDDELVFNLFYGKHRGAHITLAQVGACLYGVETQQVYCAEEELAHR